MKTLRPYQAQGLKEIFEAFKTYDIVFFCLATGGGKTVTFVEAIRNFLLQQMRTMLIAHRQELITQAYDTLYQERIMSGIIQGSIKTNYGLESQVCSIQTIGRRKDLPHTHLIVIDEGHHVTDDNTYGRIIKQYPFAKVLIVSALFYRLSGEGFRNVFPGKTVKLIMNKTLPQLQAEGWLVPLKYFVSYIPDMSDVRMIRGDVDDEDMVKALKLAPILESYHENCEGMQGLVFGQTVQHSIDISKQYNADGVVCEHVDGTTPDDDYMLNGVETRGRKRINEHYREGIVRVVTNYNVFTEGTDFPMCQFIQLAKRTMSLSAYFQMVGRGTRALPGIVDNYDSIFERRWAIEMSGKPHCVVLDNAGMALEHFGPPDVERDLTIYFDDWKKKKKEKKLDEDMEMLIWVAEDSKGTRIRTQFPEEIQGMKLVEITKETVKKIVNLKSLSEFDRLYKTYQNLAKIKKPGYMAIETYIKQCEKQRLLLVPEIWDYMERKAILEVRVKVERLQANRAADPKQYPDDMYERTLKRIQDVGVSRQWLLVEQDKYCKRNHAQLVDYGLRNRTTN